LHGCAALCFGLLDLFFLNIFIRGRIHR
jgi:hypothetical protein